MDANADLPDGTSTALAAIAIDLVLEDESQEALAVLVAPAELGRRWTAEQLTACLLGAEEAGVAEAFEVWESFRDHEARITGRRKEWDAWRITTGSQDAL